MSFFFFDEVVSTNDLAKKMRDASCLREVVLCAYKQSGGRGKGARTWFSPEGSLNFSWLFDLEASAQVHLTTILCAVQVARTIEEITGLDARIKWPNDVLIKGKKIAGILVEARWQGPRAQVICGVGINVNQTALAGDLLATATSLRLLTGENYDLDFFAKKLFIALLELREDLNRGKAEQLMLALEHKCETLGRNIKMVYSGGEVVGNAQKIASSGALVIRQGNGQNVDILEGDLHYL